MAKNYYDILGVDKKAGKDEIKKAFRKLAHQYHPDKKGGNSEKFKEVNEAYSILSDDQKEVISEILILKRNIVNFRKIMQAHKYVIQKLIESNALPASHKFRAYFEGLVDHTKEIWDTLANYQDTVNAMHDAHASLINTRSNQAMRVLTAFAVIVFPLTLIAAIFSMRTEYTPLARHPSGFWYIISGMALLGIFMLVFFKRRRWL